MSKLLALHITHLRAGGYSPKTIRDRERILDYADRRLPYGIDTPTTDEIAQFFADHGWTGWTLSTYFGHLSGFYRWACGGLSPHLSWNPLTNMRRPANPDADPDPVTDEELALALEHSNPWWQLAIVLAAYAGLRAGEISRLQRADVTAEFVTVRHGKGNKTKRLPTHPLIWQRVAPMPPGPLFPAARSEGPPNLTNLSYQHFISIGLPTVHLHRFRHWYATMLLRQGADIRTVQELMRHAKLDSTARYTEVTDGQRRFAVGTLPVFTTPHQDAA